MKPAATARQGAGTALKYFAQGAALYLAVRFGGGALLQDAPPLAHAWWALPAGCLWGLGLWAHDRSKAAGRAGGSSGSVGHG